MCGRFEGPLPPVASAPCFAIRKPAARIHRLLDYVADGIMRAEVALALSMAVVERKNVLVAGGTSSGKTTLANALLNEMAALDERVILIEDTRELQCAAARSEEHTSELQSLMPNPSADHRLHKQTANNQHHTNI